MAAAALLALSGVARPASASDEAFVPVLTLFPRESPPAGQPAHPRILPMVNVWPFVSRPDWRAATAEEAADLTIDVIRSRVRTRTLPADALHLHLKWFGVHDPTLRPEYGNIARLFFHPDDALPETFGGQPLASNFRTPYFKNGIAAGRAWLEAYIARYQRRQQQVPNIPDPAFISLDTEALPYPEEFPELCRLFDALMADARSGDPAWAIPGTGKTLKQLYAEAGSPVYSPDRPQDFRGESGGQRVDNLGFAIFYRNMVWSARAKALDEAIRPALARAWPKARYGDVCSRTFDGQMVADVPPFAPRNPMGQSWGWWPITTTGHADADIIYIYDIWNIPPAEGESRWDMVMRVQRHTLEAMIHSPSPRDPAPRPRAIAPWILLPGQSSGNNAYLPNRDDTRRMLRLLAAKGLPEAMVFMDGTAARDGGLWTDLREALDEADSCRVIRASQLTPPEDADADLLRRSNWERLPVRLDGAGNGGVEATLATTHAGRNHLLVAVELLNQPGAVRSIRVEGFDHAANAWTAIAEASAAQLGMPNRLIMEQAVVGDAARRMVDAAGMVRVRVLVSQSPGSAPVEVDLVQVTRLGDVEAGAARPAVPAIRRVEPLPMPPKVVPPAEPAPPGTKPPPPVLPRPGG
jgi:hypothetical protein